jgi:hypothetical protein
MMSSVLQSHDAGQCAMSEIVDLRLPNNLHLADKWTALKIDLSTEPNRWLRDAYAPKPDRTARDLVGMAGNVLSLRDPLHLDDNSAARPCKVSTGQLLGCFDHISASNNQVPTSYEGPL